MTARELPTTMAERARSFVARGEAPASSVPASSVLLVRDGVGGLEVYVHIRHRSMAFAGGMLAFPGGKVDPADSAVPIEGEPEWALWLGADAIRARAHVCAAIRETREETSVCLTAHDLHAWAHWITPRFEPRRFDTWFFLAALQPSQEPLDVSGEASAVAWMRPADAISGATDETGATILPPTRAILSDLAGFANVADCVASACTRVIETVLPGWVDDGDAVRVLLPGDERYPGDDPGDPP